MTTKVIAVECIDMANTIQLKERKYLFPDKNSPMKQSPSAIDSPERIATEV